MKNIRFDEKVFMSAPHMSGNEQKYISKAFQDNFIVPLGPNVDGFESIVKNYLDNDEIYAVAMNSGTSAIHIALILLDLKQDEEVFCSSGTFVATANPILYKKARPVFIDSEEKTWNICPKSLLKAIKEKEKTNSIPRVLITVDLFGMSANYDEICKICSDYNIEIIEDAAEALGSNYKGKKCGTFGRFGILSFNGNKIITTSGGGMLITHSKEEAEKALFLITQARDKAPYYLHSETGYNYRMSNICAGIGLAQMEVLEDRVDSRRNNFNYYKEQLSELPIEFLVDPDDSYSNRWLSTILIKPSAKVSPSRLIELLQNSNVEARHIWKPLHTQPLFKDHEFFSVAENPVVEYLFDYGVCLPSSSSLEEETLEKICTIIKSAF